MKRALVLMPWVTIAAAACNEPFSNEDLLFLKAVPTSEQVELRIPAGLSTCTSTPTAEYQPAGIDVAAGINQAVKDVLAILGSVSRYPVTRRENDLRIWGPWTENGIDSQLAINRVLTSTIVQGTSTSTPAEVPFYFEYVLQQKRSGDTSWVTALAGRFAPSASLNEGMGGFYLNLEEIYLKVNPASDGRGLLAIVYDNRFDQSTIEVVIDSELDLRSPFEKAEGYYRYEEDAGGNKRFDFLVEHNVDGTSEAVKEFLYIRQRYVADERGRADVAVGGGDLGEAIFSISECWDECVQRTYLATNAWWQPTYGDVSACAPELQSAPE